MPSPTDTTSDSHHIVQRATTPFPTDPGEQDTFIVTKVESAARDVVPGLGKVGEANTGNFYKIADFTKDSIIIELEARKDGDRNPIRLSGCTALIIMSERGVWFGHF